MIHQLLKRIQLNLSQVKKTVIKRKQPLTKLEKSLDTMISRFTEGQKETELRHIQLEEKRMKMEIDMEKARMEMEER